MQVTLINAAAYEGDIHVDEVTWTSAPKREFGTAKLIIPWEHEANDDQYIDPDGGSRVEIDAGVLGRWVGLTQKPAVDNATGRLEIDAMEISWLVANRVVGYRTFDARSECAELTAGQLAREAVTDALLALNWVKHGRYVDGGVTFPTFEFKGEILADVLGKLQERTGEEWEIRYDGDALVFDWRPPVRSYYVRHLADGGDLVNVSVETTVDDRVAEVIAVGSDGQRESRVAPEVSERLWVKQAVIQVDTTSRTVLGARAEQELSARRYPARIYKGKLTPGSDGVLATGQGDEIPRGLGAEMDLTAHWSSLREGDLVHLHTPRAGVPSSGTRDLTRIPRGLGMEPIQRKSGAAPLCRLLSRSFGDGRRFLDVEFQWVRPWDSGTVALARNRVTPALPVNRAGSVGRMLKTAGPAGEVSEAQISGLSTAKLRDLVTNQQIESLDGGKVTGDIDAGQLTGDVDAGLVDGELSTANIPDLDASQTTSGVFGTGRIPNLPASQINSGTFDVARIPTGIPVANLASVTAAAADLNKTTVAAWAGGATANVEQSALADIASPSTATAEDCANHINAMLSRMRGADVINT